MSVCTELVKQFHYWRGSLPREYRGIRRSIVSPRSRLSAMEYVRGMDFL